MTRPTPPSRWLLSGAAAALTVLSSCTPSEPTELRIGLLARSDGVDWAASGNPSIRGAELAVNASIARARHCRRKRRWSDKNAEK